MKYYIKSDSWCYLENEDYFFTREELDEFADEVNEKFNKITKEHCEIMDIIMKDPRTIFISIGNDDWDIETSIKFDMRKIKYPRDLLKYVELAVSKLLAEFAKIQ